jgi:hypothetical protein
MRRTSLALLIPMIASFGVACSDASAPLSPNPAAVNAPSLGKNVPIMPLVDGKLTPGEYATGDSIPFRVVVPTTAGAVPAWAYVTHDKQYMYLAITFDRTTPFHTNDLAGFEFDNDNDGISEDGDDLVFTSALSPQNVQFPGADFYRFNGGAANQSDPVINTISAFGTVGTKGVFEMRHELNSTDDAHDFSINLALAPVTLGMRIQVSLERDPVGSEVWVHTFKPGETTYCQLTIGKKTTSISCP